MLRWHYMIWHALFGPQENGKRCTQQTLAKLPGFIGIIQGRSAGSIAHAISRRGRAWKDDVCGIDHWWPLYVSIRWAMMGVQAVYTWWFWCSMFRLRDATLICENWPTYSSLKWTIEPERTWTHSYTYAVYPNKIAISINCEGSIFCCHVGLHSRCTR